MVLTLLVFSATLPAAGQKDARRAEMSWQSRLHAIHQTLIDGNFEKAYGSSTALLDSMTNEIVDGPGAGHFLGMATALRSVAALQLGREDEARWHWVVAQQVFPEVANMDMAPYGDAAVALGEHRPRGKGREPEGVLVFMPDMEKPTRVSAPYPEFPRAKLKGNRGDKVRIYVNTIIGEDGRLSDPVIQKSDGKLVFLCATLDRLREWRYEPARKDGEPVAIFFNLAVNFELR